MDSKSSATGKPVNPVSEDNIDNSSNEVIINQKPIVAGESTQESVQPSIQPQPQPQSQNPGGLVSQNPPDSLGASSFSQNTLSQNQQIESPPPQNIPKENVSAPDTISPAQAVVSTTKPKNTKKRMALVFLVILFLVGVGVLIYLIFSKEKSEPTPSVEITSLTASPKPEPTLKEVPTPVLNKTKKYFNITTRLSFDYDSKFLISTESGALVVKDIEEDEFLRIEVLELNRDLFEIASEFAESTEQGLNVVPVTVGGKESFMFELSDSSKRFYLITLNESFFAKAQETIVDKKSVNYSMEIENLLSSLTILPDEIVAGCEYLSDLERGSYLDSYCSGELCAASGTELECSALDVVSVLDGNLSQEKSSDGVGDCIWQTTGFSGQCVPKY